MQRSSSVGDVHSNNSGASAHAAPRSARTAASAQRPKNVRGSGTDDSGATAGKDAAAPAPHSQPATSDRSIPQPGRHGPQSDVRAGPPPEALAAGEACAQEEAVAAAHPSDGAAAAEPEAAAVGRAAADTTPPEAGQTAEPADTAPAAGDQASETAASCVEETAAAEEGPEAETGAAPEAPSAEPQAEEGSPSSSVAAAPAVDGLESAGSGKAAVEAPSTAVQDQLEDPDMPSTPDQAKSASHLVRPQSRQARTTPCVIRYEESDLWRGAQPLQAVPNQRGSFPTSLLPMRNPLQKHAFTYRCPNLQLE